MYRTLIVLLTLMLAPYYSNAHEIDANQPNTQITYDEETVNFFTEVALGFEYGNASKVIRKWDEDIKIRVSGNPGTVDLITLFKVVTELNDLIGDKINLSIVQEDEYYNVEIYFGKLSAFKSKTSSYRDNNWGYFEVLYDGDNYIREALILESTDMPTRLEKNHLIKEEVSQILGLARDSGRYSDSIFYDQYGDTQNYSEMDRRVVQMLYLDEIKPGMSTEQVISVFKDLNKIK